MSPLLFALVVCVSASIGTVGSYLLVRFERRSMWVWIFLAATAASLAAAAIYGT